MIKHEPKMLLNSLDIILENVSLFVNTKFAISSQVFDIHGEEINVQKVTNSIEKYTFLGFYRVNQLTKVCEPTYVQ